MPREHWLENASQISQITSLAINPGSVYLQLATGILDLRVWNDYSVAELLLL
jgi:hypothetical protein